MTQDIASVQVTSRHPDTNGAPWSAVPFVDVSECDHTETLCASCAESWEWDWIVRYPPKVLITKERMQVIRDARERLGLTWQDLADQSGVKVGTLGSMGYEVKSYLPALSLRRLAHALDTPTSVILGLDAQGATVATEAGAR